MATLSASTAKMRVDELMLAKKIATARDRAAIGQAVRWIPLAPHDVAKVQRTISFDVNP